MIALKVIVMLMTKLLNSTKQYLSTSNVCTNHEMTQFYWYCQRTLVGKRYNCDMFMVLINPDI